MMGNFQIPHKHVPEHPMLEISCDLDVWHGMKKCLPRFSSNDCIGNSEGGQLVFFVNQRTWQLTAYCLSNVNNIVSYRYDTTSDIFDVLMINSRTRGFNGVIYSKFTERPHKFKVSQFINWKGDVKK